MVVYAFIVNGGLGESSEEQVPDLSPYPWAKRLLFRRQLPQRSRPPRACNLKRVRFDPDNEELIKSNDVSDQGMFLIGLISSAWREAVDNPGKVSWRAHRYPASYFLRSIDTVSRV
jgi:hypothetical protein